MLDQVVGSVVDAITERELDTPFMALLRHDGFVDVHLTHGSYEFGKDFIARRADGPDVVQYVFQSKAGNLNLKGWTSIRGQIEMLRSNELVHPAFDAGLPRRAVLVLTGRLVGGAAIEAQDYCRQARSAVPLEIWDRESLVEKMVAALDAALDGIEGSFLRVLASIASQSVTDRDLERHSRRWCLEGQVGPSCTLEAAILAVELRKEERLDLASYVGLALVRASCRQMHAGGQGDDWQSTTELGRLMFRTYAEELWNRCQAETISTTAGFVRAHFDPAAIATYRVRCLRTIEVLGLLGLAVGDEDRPSSVDVARWVAGFIEAHPGASEPISDRWAVAFIPAALLLARHGLRDVLVRQLTGIARWVAEAYSEYGLAGPYAEPVEELRQLFGRAAGFESPRRSGSYVAAVVLELTAFLGLRAVYRETRREVLSAGVSPCVLATDDTAGQYTADGEGSSLEASVAYRDQLPSDWTLAAGHLAAASAPRFLQGAIGQSWNHLAVSAVLRDRHFVCGWPFAVDEGSAASGTPLKEPE